jgi:hypothetical protein
MTRISRNRSQLEPLPGSRKHHTHRPIPLAQARLISSNPEHFWIVFLWEDQDAYEVGAGVSNSQTLAVCMTEMLQDDMGNYIVAPKLGSIHFVSGTWSINTVAHEITHAVLHRLRYMEPKPAQVLQEMSPTYDPDDEEVIAYESGDWVEKVMIWLTDSDPKSPYPAGTFGDTYR